MELKQDAYAPFTSATLLLIVPYGIETILTNTHQLEGMNLLIVPYGIETQVDVNSKAADTTF